MTPEVLLAQASRQGVRLEPRGTRLHVAGPRPVVEALLPKMRASKVELLRLLGKTRRPWPQEGRRYHVFEYRPMWSERWLVLFSIRPGDTVEQVRSNLEVRFGCTVAVRLRAQHPCRACPSVAAW